MITEKERLILRYGYKIEYCDNHRFFLRFNRKIKIAKCMHDKKKRFFALWNTADHSHDADFYFALLKLHFPEFHK